jgi:hypothetical protein
VGPVTVGLREAAGAIRLYLPRLLGDRAAAVDTALSDLLGAGDEEGLAATLAADPVTEAWTAVFLETGLPPEFTERDRGYSPPPGSGERVAARRFACPQGDFIWYERSVIEQPPVCPTHGSAIEPA